MIAYAINLPPDVQAQINSFSAQYSVDSLVASAVAQVSSGGQQFFSDGGLVVTPFGVGVMGISKNVSSALSLDATTQIGNIQAGVATLAALLAVFVGNYPLALAAYLTSVATVQQFNGIPPIAQVSDFVYNVSKIAADAGSTNVSSLYKIRNDSTVDPFGAATTTGNLIDPRTTGINYGSGNEASKSAANLNELQSTISPLLQVTDYTLTNTAWYADTGLVTGNPHIRASVQPVSFIVYLDRNDPTKFLQNPNTNQPIEIQLNTSLSSFEITSKHVYNRTPSRTGMHITLWGMEPDLINGQGTTGVFMNQFGITDFMSTVGINDDISKLLISGFQSPQFASIQNANTTVVTTQPATTSTRAFNIDTTVDQTQTGQVLEPQANQTTAQKIVAAQGLNNPNEAFRVAAQDAFIEFLKLFQMNGNIWFYSTSYANGTNLGTIGQSEQQAPTAWSSKTGASSFQQHSRNNDVMSRGYVAMRYRNNTYLGYFKSLSWTQDADSPFQWKFNFTFQVEKTYTALYYSNVQAQIQQNITQLKATFGDPQPPPPAAVMVTSTIGGIPTGPGTVTPLPPGE